MLQHCVEALNTIAVMAVYSCATNSSPNRPNRILKRVFVVRDSARFFLPRFNRRLVLAQAKDHANIRTIKTAAAFRQNSSRAFIYSSMEQMSDETDGLAQCGRRSFLKPRFPGVLLIH